MCCRRDDQLVVVLIDRDEALAKSAVERAMAEFGRVDMAYSNAGILGPMCPMVEETADGFDKVNAVNLRGI